jgi:hypothetical protein
MGMVGILYRDPATGARTTTPVTVARANLAEGKPFDAERPHRNTFGWLNPVLDIFVAGASPLLYGLYRGGQTLLDNQRERREAQREANAPPADEPTPEPVIDNSPIASEYNDARLGGIPVSMLYQLGAGDMQQTPAARLVAAKAAGRKGGQRSAKRRKKKAAASRAPKRKKIRKSKSGKMRLKKGSAAAKAWGAKMKRLRKK